MWANLRDRGYMLVHLQQTKQRLEYITMSTVGSTSYAANCAAAFEVAAGGGNQLESVGCDGSLHAQMHRSSQTTPSGSSFGGLYLMIGAVLLVGCIVFGRHWLRGICGTCISWRNMQGLHQRDQKARRGYVTTLDSDSDDAELGPVAVGRKNIGGTQI